MNAADLMVREREFMASASKLQTHAERTVGPAIHAIVILLDTDTGMTVCASGLDTDTMYNVLRQMLKGYDEGRTLIREGGPDAGEPN